MLHRDLKPSNVMLDGEGRVRLADFGLSTSLDSLTAADIRVGTPAYMAPEQLEGKAVSRQSDIYSLGLVLFELFTGRPAFEAATTFDDLLRQRRDQMPAPSTVLPDIDAAADAAIRRCLAHDPGDRPHSASEVAAALPGGDPLAAAMAAGETPSLALVAAAGGSAARQGVAIALAAFVILGLLGRALGERRTTVLEAAAPELSPAVLAHGAKQLAGEFGYPDPVDHAFGVSQRLLTSLLELPPEQRWQRLDEPALEAVRFWYRGAPHLMEPEANPRA